MPIFSRRRIQAMLDELAPFVGASHFIGRLNDKRFEQALPAEAELALVWAVSRLGGFESEPEWFSDRGRRPEGISTKLVPGVETVFDVKALSDRVIPGVAGMRKLSRKMMEISNKAVRRSGNKLEFFFFERSDFRTPRLHRSIYAPPQHSVSEEIARKLQGFVKDRPAEGEFIDLLDDEMMVRVTWKTSVDPRFNFRSSTVNEIFDIEDNYIANALREKAVQLRSPNFRGLRGALLVDIGSEALKRIDRLDPNGRAVNGSQIIQHFLLDDECGLDFVAVFSPQVDRQMMGDPDHHWKTAVLPGPRTDFSMEGFTKIASMLPRPWFDGYQFAHLHEQGLFGSQSRGWYLGTTMSSKKASESMAIRLSARALHEFLAGRIDASRLRENIIGGSGVFERQLVEGRTIQTARIVPGGIDEGDDFLELVFAPDPSASEFSDRGSLADGEDEQ